MSQHNENYIYALKDASGYDPNRTYYIINASYLDGRNLNNYYAITPVETMYDYATNNWCGDSADTGPIAYQGWLHLDDSAFSTQIYASSSSYSYHEVGIGPNSGHSSYSGGAINSYYDNFSSSVVTSGTPVVTITMLR